MKSSVRELSLLKNSHLKKKCIHGIFDKIKCCTYKSGYPAFMYTSAKMHSAIRNVVIILVAGNSSKSNITHIHFFIEIQVCVSAFTLGAK